MREYRIRKTRKKYQCMIWKCENYKYKARGLCESHHAWFGKSGQLEKYADPDKKTYFYQSKYGTRLKIKVGICRIIENKKFCNKEVHQRGMCTKHCSIFRLHKVFEKYAAPSKLTPGGPFQIKKRNRTGVCHLIDGGIRCGKQSHWRGLCGAHAKYLDDRGLLDKYGILGKKW